MRRSFAFLTFSSASLQKKGQLGNRESALYQRSLRRTDTTSIALDFNDVVGGGGTAHGQLINRGRIAAVSDHTMGGVMSRLGRSPPQNGMNSLAFQVSLMEKGLLYEATGSKVGNGPNKLRGLIIETADREANKSSAGKYDDFLPKLLQSRKPNIALSEAEMAKLRRHQRLLRSELHARAQILLETAFAAGVPQNLTKKSKIGSKKNDDSAARRKSENDTYVAGSNFRALASFFNLFRLTRLSFTLDGEVIFTPEGSMEWQSLEETKRIESEISRRELFADDSRNTFISSNKRHETNELYSRIAAENDDKNDVKLEQLENDRSTLISSSSDPAVAPSTRVSGENKEGSSSALQTLDNKNKQEKRGGIVLPKVSADGHGTLQILSPQLQRTNLSNDMQKIMTIALNAVEVELRAVDRELKTLLVSESFEVAKEKTVSDEDATPPTPSGAFMRRANRLLSEVDEAMSIIADSLFMCGRGTDAVNDVLDAVEEAVVGSQGEGEGALDGASNNSRDIRDKKRTVSRPFLLQKLVEARQAFYAPQQE